jgi:CheY-like chemotaxis protein
LRQNAKGAQTFIFIFKEAHLMALVLSVGSDPALMQSRQLVLEGEGHTVVGVTDEKALAAACKRHTFDVAILSQTLSPRMKQHIVSLIRERCPKIKVLELFSIPDGHE